MKGSLRNRVIALSTVWTVLAVALLGWLLVTQYRLNAERGFADLQQAQLFSLIAAFRIADDGTLTGTPNLGDRSFREAASGWYWQVAVVGSDAPARQSVSLGGQFLTGPSLAEVPYDEQFTRTFETEGPAGNRLRVLEAEVQIGPAGEIAFFQLAGNQSEFDAAIAALGQNIALLLTLFGAGLVAINGAIIVFGMRPLNRVREALRAIHAGEEHALAGRYPDEIQPMVDEMNMLIDNNRRVVERARTQVGNLAHSLKTPVSVLKNEADRGEPVDPRLVADQADAMKAQVEHYLHRARIAAQTGGTAFRTDIAETLGRLVKVMRKLNPDKSIALELPAAPPAFAGEKEDFEEICGNLLENACKWADERIRVGLTNTPGDDRSFTISVDDDGPGIAAGQRTQALRRGQRLDETKPGTGLGLSIVVETVEAYKGHVSLGESEMGGLRVTLILPRARTAP
ncbi:ATP-binding protein [Oceaniradius stylonematis]|uniref:ATP-binding protein n=1 Tax=Oceaniradius stylonematis TaxID=2184161 RepID=UPI0011C46DED|nr:ATP-binding protein [Oceaniradius stylonematis]